MYSSWPLVDIVEVILDVDISPLQVYRGRSILIVHRRAMFEARILSQEHFFLNSSFVSYSRTSG
jgi:hypothetical protein